MKFNNHKLNELKDITKNIIIENFTKIKDEKITKIINKFKKNSETIIILLILILLKKD
jgi:inosine/xanthosine triphosphate pyrophosphatase family protein